MIICVCRGLNEAKALALISEGKLKQYLRETASTVTCDTCRQSIKELRRCMIDKHSL